MPDRRRVPGSDPLSGIDAVLRDAWEDLTWAARELLLSVIAGFPIDDFDALIELRGKDLIRLFPEYEATALGLDVAGLRPAQLYATGGVVKGGWSLVDEGCSLAIPEKRTEEQPSADSRQQHNSPGSKPLGAQAEAEGGAVDTSMEAEPHSHSTTWFA